MLLENEVSIFHTAGKYICNKIMITYDHETFTLQTTRSERVFMAVLLLRRHIEA